MAEATAESMDESAAETMDNPQQKSWMNPQLKRKRARRKMQWHSEEGEKDGREENLFAYPGARFL